MNRIRTLLVSGSAMVVLMTGCIRYLEEPTPAGQVPPPAPTKATRSSPSDSTLERALEPAQPRQKRAESKAVEWRAAAGQAM